MPFNAGGLVRIVSNEQTHAGPACGQEALPAVRRLPTGSPQVRQEIINTILVHWRKFLNR